MLRRGKFDEARNFAAAFNLDPEMVYKEQVKGVMSKLDVWQAGTKSIQELFEEMMDYLNKIKVNKSNYFLNSLKIIVKLFLF